MFTLDLPFPPSLNNLFVNRPGGRHPSTKYKTWKTEAGWEIARQHPVPIAGPVKLVYVIQDKGRCDLGNLEKATTDLLVTHKLIDGDSRKTVREINLSWSSAVVGARLTVTRFIQSSPDCGESQPRRSTAAGPSDPNHGPAADQFVDLNEKDCGASASRTSPGRVPPLKRDPGEGQFHAPSSQVRSTGDVVIPQPGPDPGRLLTKVDQTLRPGVRPERSGLDCEPA